MQSCSKCSQVSAGSATVCTFCGYAFDSRKAAEARAVAAQPPQKTRSPHPGAVMTFLAAVGGFLAGGLVWSVAVTILEVTGLIPREPVGLELFVVKEALMLTSSGMGAVMAVRYLRKSHLTRRG